MQQTLSEATRAECRHVHKHVWDYLDGHLAAQETASLLAHIAECKHCLDYGQFQERVLDALSALRVRDAAPWHVKARVIDLLTSDGYAPR